MSDLIDRQAAIKAIEQMQLPIMRSDLLHEQFIFQGLSEALAAIKELPSAFQDWQKIILSNLFTRKGEWIKAYGDHEAFGVRPFYYYCSECNKLTFFPYDFCPNCGARMDSSNE